MKSIRYILILLAASTVWGCIKDIDDESAESATSSSSSVVELTEDGRYKVTAQLESVSMTSVVTRATSYEDIIYDGWCLVFGEDETNYNGGTNSTGNYSDDSPLIQLERVTVNANGTFTMVFDEYPNTAFMRIVVNLTDREDANLESGITSWRMAVNANPDDGISLDTPPTFDQVEKYSIATFGQYRHQSVGLDGIYDVAYTTTATLVDFEVDHGGFQNTADGSTAHFEEATTSTFNSASAGYKDVVDYTDYANPKITSYVQYSVQYETDGGKAGTSTITNLDETYNENQPDPATPKSTGFPMASYGFVMTSISETTLDKAFGNIVEMIRVCSKVQVVVEDSDFTMEEVYLIDAAQESRIRSSVLANSGVGGATEVNSSFSIPVNLGGTIDYKKLTTSEKSSGSIYFYPNSGGGYVYTDGVVNQDINPQYIIIKGQSSNYDTPGYYKVALKAIYATDASSENTSGLTYDILRNTSFTVKLEEIDKPGYKTFEDAADANSPANNISYSMVIESSDNRYEVLVSKGTYYVELETSRVYIKGYMDEGIDGCYLDFTMYPSEFEVDTDDGGTEIVSNYVPTVYVQSSDHNYEFTDNEDVVVTHCLVMRKGDTGYDADDWGSATQVDPSDNDTDDGLGDQLVEIESSDKETKVRVYFDAEDSGRIRLRIGDILKFIPVVYDRIPISIYGTKGQDGTDATDTGVVVTDAYGTSWSDFSYSDIDEQAIGVYADDYSATDLTDANGETFGLNSNGTITFLNSGNYNIKPELRARIMPTDAGDGNAVLYLRQASDFKLTNDGADILDDTQIEEGNEYSVTFNYRSHVKNNNTGGLFTESDLTTYTYTDITSGEDETAEAYTSITFDVNSSSFKSSSVDEVTIDIETTVTTEDPDDPTKEASWPSYFEEVEKDDKIILSTGTIEYDLNAPNSLVYGYSGTTRGTLRQAYIESDVLPSLVLGNNTATSVIAVTNVAGDYKTYTVYQIQYPPLYMVDVSGEDTKEFSFDPTSPTDYACVFALNFWNYTSDCSKRSSYSLSYNNYGLLSSNTQYDGNVVYKNIIQNTYFFESDYLTNSYDWTNDKSKISLAYNSLAGNEETVTPAEIWKIGGYQYADCVLGIIRNTNYKSTGLTRIYCTATYTIIVEDGNGDTYKTTKVLYGED